MRIGFSEQELAEMRAFDEMIDRLDFVDTDPASQWIDDLAKLDQMDHLQRKALDRNRKYRAANKERIAEQSRAYYAERKRRKQDETDRRT